MTYVEDVGLIDSISGHKTVYSCCDSNLMAWFSWIVAGVCSREFTNDVSVTWVFSEFACHSIFRVFEALDLFLADEVNVFSRHRYV